MPFLKRLGFYLVGLSIGIIFLTLFLKKKSEETGTEFCYLPNCRVLKDIRSKKISYSDPVNRLLENKKLDSADIDYFFNEGDIDFSQSDTKSKPCKTFVIEGMVDQREAVLTITNCDSTAVVERVEF